MASENTLASIFEASEHDGPSHKATTQSGDHSDEHFEITHEHPAQSTDADGKHDDEVADSQPRKKRRRLLHLHGKKHDEELQRIDTEEGKIKTSKWNKSSNLTTFSQLRAIFFNSWFHLLLLVIPAGFAVQYTHSNAVVVFVVNFFAMVPSIMILALAVDNFMMYTGETIGALVSITFR